MENFFKNFFEVIANLMAYLICGLFCAAIASFFTDDKFIQCITFWIGVLYSPMVVFVNLVNERKRIRRLHYVIGISTLTVFAFGLIFALLSILPSQFGYSNDNIGNINFNINTIIIAFIISLFLYSYFTIIAISAARFRDINSNPHFAWLLLIPFVNLLVLLALCFIPGTPGKNQYSDNPKLKGVEPPQPSHDNASNSSSD